MAGEIFLARTEEQEKFKQVLHSHHKNLWQILQTPLFNKPVENDLPFVLLFYGEGGMGKTRLIHRLRQIAEEEKPYADKFNTLFLDWEDKQNHNLGLQVGHDNISPETVLQVLHDAFVAKNWGSYFGEYRKLMENLKAIEAKVDQDLKSRPDKEIETHIRKLGAKGIAWIVRQAPGADVLPSQSLEPVFEKAIQVGAEGLYQARQFVQKVLTPKEYEIYAQPYERLAEALGKGIAELAKRKPLVVFLDTYEIVDRPECDYTLRSAIQQSGKQVVWVIAGRANLADSGQRGSLYFRGYKRDFPEDQIYAKPLSEFGLTEIQEYFINYAYPYNGLGDVYAYQGKCDEAIAAYKCAISLDPKCASAYNGLGWSYLMRNDLIQAKAQFEAAIPLDPKRYYYPVFNLGLVYALEGKVDEAHSQWQKSLAICQGGSAWDRAFRSLYTVAVGESKRGIAEMRKIIHEDRSALGVLQEMLGDAEILARCPVKPEGIDTVIDVLKQAIG